VREVEREERKGEERERERERERAQHVRVLSKKERGEC